MTVSATDGDTNINNDITYELLPADERLFAHGGLVRWFAKCKFVEVPYAGALLPLAKLVVY